MDGYFERPEATAAVFHNGWLRTGDMGAMDENGFVYFHDRLKDMVKTGGLNVYSQEVERALQKFPAVREVAIIGLPSEKWGEEVVAVVVARDGTTVDADELIAFAKANLASYKAPKRVVVIPTTRCRSTTPARSSARPARANRSALWRHDRSRFRRQARRGHWRRGRATAQRSRGFAASRRAGRGHRPQRRDHTVPLPRTSAPRKGLADAFEVDVADPGACTSFARRAAEGPPPARRPGEQRRRPPARQGDRPGRPRQLDTHPPRSISAVLSTWSWPSSTS
jgi:hypothetical protein